MEPLVLLASVHCVDAAFRVLQFEENLCDGPDYDPVGFSIVVCPFRMLMGASQTHRVISGAHCGTFSTLQTTTF